MEAYACISRTRDAEAGMTKFEAHLGLRLGLKKRGKKIHVISKSKVLEIISPWMQRVWEKAKGEEEEKMPHMYENAIMKLAALYANLKKKSWQGWKWLSG